jgi:hypothetical protein
MIAREVCLLPEDCANLAAAGAQQRRPVTEGNCETNRSFLAEQGMALTDVKGSHGE